MMMKLNRTTPESRGISSKAISTFLDYIEENNIELHSFMIGRGGDVVVEAWWKPYAPDIPHEMYSLSKSFTSTAVGFAVQDGLLTVDDLVLDFFPDFKNPCDNLKKMKVKHLLSMNTGHTHDTYNQVLYGEHDCVTNFLEIDVEKEPGTHFLYNTGATYMLSAIVYKLVGKNINDYLDEKLYKPLGIKYPLWETSKDGVNRGGTGLYITTEDIMKFGIFLLNHGTWQGESLLNSEWIKESAYPHSDTSNGEIGGNNWEQGYGYQYWMCKHGAYRADGAFGQMCIVMDNEDTCIAITAGADDGQVIMEGILDTLLPGICDKELEENHIEHQKLLDRIAGLEYPVVYSDVTDTVESQVSGGKYLLDENRLGIKSVEFDFHESGCDIKMHHDGGLLEFTAGGKKPIYGEMIRPSHFPLLLNAIVSGTWISHNEYKVTSRFYETAYTMESVFKFHGDEISMNNTLNVLFKPFTIKGKVV